MRPTIGNTARWVLLASLFAAGGPAAAGEDGFSRFGEYVHSLWPAAQAEGITRRTFDSAFRDVHLDRAILANTERQPEFVEPIWRYLAGIVSPPRIGAGRSKLAIERSWLVKAHAVFGADEAAILGIWGLETDYGAFAGNDYVVGALANLAFADYRGDYFRDELLAALKILQSGDIDPRFMRGSWAGAMGQPQFMPSSYLNFAVDFDARGRRDIWNDAPDTIGSIGNYLQKHGWTRDLPWGFEVALPHGFRLSTADFAPGSTYQSFVQRGVRPVGRHGLPPDTPVRLAMPAGLKGPVFLITTNFDVIKTYNNSTAYALGVALLGDAVTGRGSPPTNWPVKDHVFDADEIRKLQAGLKARNIDVGSVDGVAGPKLEAAVRAYQASVGLAPDGYPTLPLLRSLEQGR